MSPNNMEEKALLPASEENNVFVLPRQRYVQRRKIATLFLWVISVIFLCFLVFIVASKYRNRQVEIIILKESDYVDESIDSFIDSNDDNLYNIFDDVSNYDRDVFTKVTEKEGNSGICTNVLDKEKFDCYPDAPVTEQQCVARGCCWKPVQNKVESSASNFPPLNVPYCYYPANYTGYNITEINSTDKEINARLQRVIPSGFPKDVMNAVVKVWMNDSSLRIQIKDATAKRYEVPFEEIFQRQLFPTSYWSLEKQYEVKLNRNGDLIVKRSTTQQIIFHTDLRRLVFAEQFLQLSSRLPSPYIYGLGQHKSPLRRSVSWQRFTLFNRDRSPVENMNLYGSHPFYLALEDNGDSHGVFLLNSNAIDVILQPTPAVTFRPIGGIFDFFIFLGPEPDLVIQQYTNIIGTTMMPPYWSLGFHLCRYGYKTLNRTKQIWQQTRQAKIPFDTQWNDIDYMNKNNDFTYDRVNYAGLPEFVDELHSVGMHYVPIIDPGISNAETPGTYPPFDDGLEMGIFIKNWTGQIFIGKVWNSVSTVFPDFTHPKAADYWTEQIENYHNKVKIDGAWIDMNEPSNFYNGQINGCPPSRFENPPYVPGGIEPLKTKTLCMTCWQYASLHYNVHNLYGLYEAIATNIALKKIRNKRPFIISRSTFSGSGHFTGNWDGDISSSWDNMRWTIPSILNFNMFGIPMIGADICGFNGNTTVELCARWSALGAFYPFSRNHNTDDAIDQDPVSLGPEVVSAARNSLSIRYYFLPYLYTLFYKSHMFGETVARPLFFEYPKDKNTYDIDKQFLWGRSLMIIPVLEQNVSKITAYIPSDTWYSFNGTKLFSGANNTFDAPIDTINLAFRAGSIIPAQLPDVTTTASRLKPFQLLVILNDDNEATGDLFLDDGDSLDTIKYGQYSFIQFIASKNQIKTSANPARYTDMPLLNSTVIFNCRSKPTGATANGRPVIIYYNNNLKILVLNDLRLNLTQSNVIIWK